MEENISQQFNQRLTALSESIKHDSDAVRAGSVKYPELQAILDVLFDATQSTLQNVDRQLAEKTE